ncbi:MAG: hypothetical protein M1835_007137, partial [Candelina submexicana]
MRAAVVLSAFLATLAVAVPVAQEQDQGQVQEHDWKPTLGGNHQPTTSVDGTDPANDGQDKSAGLRPSPQVADPKNAKVTNAGAFNSGAGNRNNANTRDGVGNGQDVYRYYQGPAGNFPDKSKWVSFENMFNNYKPQMKKGCGNNGWGPEDTDSQINDIYDGIQTVAKDSLVDHRFILAVIMQE